MQKNFRSEENNREVVIPPRNILTNPPKVGKIGKNTSFAGVIPYMEDDFNRPKKLHRALVDHNAEQIEKIHGGKNFSQKVR